MILRDMSGEQNDRRRQATGKTSVMMTDSGRLSDEGTQSSTPCRRVNLAMAHGTRRHQLIPALTASRPFEFQDNHERDSRFEMMGKVTLATAAAALALSSCA